MELLYRFVPQARKLDSYEEAYKDNPCLIISCDAFKTLVVFEDGCKFDVPTDELFEVKFGSGNVWVH